MTESERLRVAVGRAVTQTIDQFLISGAARELSEIFSAYFTKEHYLQHSYLFILRYECGVTYAPARFAPALTIGGLAFSASTWKPATRL